MSTSLSAVSWANAGFTTTMLWAAGEEVGREADDLRRPTRRLGEDSSPLAAPKDLPLFN